MEAAKSIAAHVGKEKGVGHTNGCAVTARGEQVTTRICSWAATSFAPANSGVRAGGCAIHTTYAWSTCSKQASVLLVKVNQLIAINCTDPLATNKHVSLIQ